MLALVMETKNLLSARHYRTFPLTRTAPVTDRRPVAARAPMQVADRAFQVVVLVAQVVNYAEAIPAASGYVLSICCGGWTDSTPHPF